MILFHTLLFTDKGRWKTKEVSTQTHEIGVATDAISKEPPGGAPTSCDVTNASNGLSTGAVPKTKVKAVQQQQQQPSSQQQLRPFLPGSPEVTSLGHRPLFVCNRASTPVKVTSRWKRRPRTQWESTAKTMLDMTVIYLRKLPQVRIGNNSGTHLWSQNLASDENFDVGHQIG